MLESKVPISLKKGTVYFKEFSFYEYKNICKMLISNDVEDINHCLNIIIDRVERDFTLNIIDKFDCLVNIRNSILGKELGLTLEDRQVIFNLSDQLLDKFEEAEFTFGDCVFKTPSFFTHSNIQLAVADYLHSYKDKNISNAPLNDKLEVLNSLDLPIIKLVSEIEKVREENTITILGDTVSVNIYDINILIFLKSIITSDLMDLYSFEYQLLRHLNLKGNDLQYFTYPELKIKINMFMKEKEDEQSSSNSKPIE
jgi:hypothetical protein